MGWVNDISRLFFPLVCEACGRTLVEGERVLCLDCHAGMPRVNVHADSSHPMALRLAGGARVDRVASMMAYVRDTAYARVIQRSKYDSRPDIDRELAKMFASELLPSGFFEGIDVVLPVPMHVLKKLRRGYNQAEVIARGVGEVTGIGVADNLIAERGHRTQTRKGAAERMKNAAGLYGVAYPEELEGKHVLLADDVITTGATVFACCDALHAAVNDVRISVFTLAATRLS